jgi:pimeloyl-ACP methyl ester carboxylesterase
LLDLFKRRPKAPLLHIANDVGEGPVVVLVHGIASSGATFEKLLPMLQEHYRCISIDLLGFGESPVPPDATYTVEEHVASLTRTIESLRLREPFTLVGHSLGSLLAARYAATHRREVGHLVLVSPPVYLAPSELGDPRVRAQVGAYLKVYEFMRNNKDFTMGAAAQVVKLFALGKTLDITERNWTPFVLSLQHCIESQTTVSDIASVVAPVDVVYGAFDQFLAPGTMKIVEQLRNVTVTRVEVSDHVLRTRLSRAVAAVIGRLAQPETAEAVTSAQ